MSEKESNSLHSSPVLDVIQAVLKTIESPSYPVLIEDIVLIHKLVREVKEKLAGKCPSLSLLFHFLFNLEK